MLAKSVGLSSGSTTAPGINPPGGGKNSAGWPIDCCGIVGRGGCMADGGKCCGCC